MNVRALSAEESALLFIAIYIPFKTGEPARDPGKPCSRATLPLSA